MMSLPQPLDMTLFDPGAFEQFVIRRRDATTSQRHRQILDNLLLHSRFENRGDLAALANVLSKQSQSYVTFGHDGYPQPSSYDEAIAFYEVMFASCAYVHHLEVEHLTVSDDSIAVDGVMHMVYPPAIAAVMFDGTAGHAAAYQVSLRMAIVFLFDDKGLSAGEHVYTPAAPTVTPIADDDLPELYLAALQRSGQTVGQ
jgi:hypothetical protein